MMECVANGHHNAQGCVDTMPTPRRHPRRPEGALAAKTAHTIAPNWRANQDHRHGTPARCRRLRHPKRSPSPWAYGGAAPRSQEAPETPSQRAAAASATPAGPLEAPSENRDVAPRHRSMRPVCLPLVHPRPLAAQNAAPRPQTPANPEPPPATPVLPELFVPLAPLAPSDRSAPSAYRPVPPRPLPYRRPAAPKMQVWPTCATADPIHGPRDRRKRPGPTPATAQPIPT